MANVLESYRREAADLAARFDALAAQDVLAPLAPYLPPAPAKIADIGAGTGRDAAWLAMQGYQVTAVEPVQELAALGRARNDRDITWINDYLPGLDVIRGAGRLYDIAIAVSVWHHLSEAQSLLSLRSLADVVRPGGCVAFSLKVFGDGRASLAVANVEAQATATGFAVVATFRTPSLQQHNRQVGNTWDWLILDRNTGTSL